MEPDTSRRIPLYALYALYAAKSPIATRVPHSGGTDAHTVVARSRLQVYGLIALFGDVQRISDREEIRRVDSTEAMMKFDELKETISTLKSMLADAGRADDPFEYQAVCIDRFGLDGYKEQQEIGVTDVITVPWIMYGVPNTADVAAKQDGIKKFADDYISHF